LWTPRQSSWTVVGLLIEDYYQLYLEQAIDTGYRKLKN
jgi:hypothetical protein